ncbi:guanylate kinase [Beggiatoa leptomitoformis]|uniref:Guanylate kinase n=1 Tax=Beggiatoa leptomitoformis TaxID=288004 RepID=A0A2N9YDZ8_9GAMM|nr:guanylate kinase [Beggiatoa leptomitoformis]ALG68915.1 guanylate kinase [Beggiatoa leptomitoformis]AUI68707.1 guanylate kinase [Beggiatoa leptomitoformis]
MTLNQSYPVTGNQQGVLYVIAAPSGAGKTSLVAALLQRVSNICVSVSHTTRAARPAEVNGVNYHFVSIATFEAMLTNAVFFEHAKVYDNYYGTSKQTVVEKLQQGIDVILEIDWQGAQSVRALMPDSVSIFILPPSRQILEQRLRARGQDTETVITRRMQAAVAEMSHYSAFDYVVINDQFEQALQDLQAIVQTQRLTRARQQVKYAQLLTELLA